SPLPSKHGHHLVRIEGRTDIVLGTLLGFQRVNGANGQTVWETSLQRDAQPAAKNHPDYVANHFTFTGPTNELQLMGTALDLTGDDVEDLVFINTRAELLAVSGGNGKVLWWFASKQPGWTKNEASSQEVAGRPVLVQLAAEKKPLCIGTFAWHGQWCVEGV